ARVVERGAPRPRSGVMPNFVDLDQLQPASRVNEFAAEYGLEDKFVVSYAGNMGHAQELDTVLDAAIKTRDNRAIQYVLIGDGVITTRIARRIQNEGIDNVLMIGHQPYERMPAIYAASDVCLVPLAQHVDGSALPSKVFRIMACARPILA